MPRRLPNQRQPKVLYVDDEAANLADFSCRLGERFQVLTTRRPSEALAMLARQRVGVLVADQRMPQMSGAELCARARERHPEVVRIIVTGFSDVAAVVEAINAGHVSRYLFKPWPTDEMGEVLTEALEAFARGQLSRRLQMELMRSGQEAAGAYLAGRVLHEIGNPLAALGASLKLAGELSVTLSARLAGAAPGVRRQAEYLHEAVQNSAEVAAQLIARVEQYRRGESPAGRVEATADPNRAVSAALALIDAESRGRAQLEVDLGDVPPVRAEAVHLSQILLNLLTNALESSSASGTRRPVTVRTLARGDRVLLEVRDRGAGMPPEVLARAFEPFFSTRSGPGPRGLGLAVVRDLVRRLGGDIRIESEPGQGTCVTVELPSARG